MTAPATTRPASITEAIIIIKISLYIVSPPVLHDKDIYVAIVYSHTAGLGSLVIDRYCYLLADL